MTHFLLTVFPLLSILCSAQIDEDRLEASRAGALTPVVNLGPLPASFIPDHSGDGPVVGVTRKVAPAEGIWVTLRSGKRVWRLTIESPGASALKLHIQSRMRHGRIWVYADEEAAKSALPYSAGGPLGDGDFWTSSEKGDRLTVAVATDSEVVGAPIVVSEIAHLEPVRLSAVVQKERTAKPVCSPADPGQMPQPWRSIAAAVGLMLFQTEDGTWTTCTGTLLNDREGTRAPFFLTAHQCISTSQRARSLEVYLRFDTWWIGPSINPIVEVPTGYPYRATGARILASAGTSEGDSSLLELGTLSFAAAFAGWNGGADLTAGAEIGTIHHPLGNYSRLILGSIVGSAVPPTTVGGLARIGPSDYFQMVYHGFDGMEDGSVGGAMFRSDGILHGILSKASCADISKYSRFGTFLPRVQRYLNPSVGASCNVTVDLANGAIEAIGGSGTFTVTAPSRCLWSVAADNDWITVTPKRGSGTGTSSYTVSTNGAATPRVGSISIIGEQRRVVHFTQAGRTPVVSDDVPDTHPFYKEIAFLLQNNGLADFCQTGRFCPDATTTRGTMAQFIVRSLNGSDSFTYPATPYFTDVPATHPLFKYIQVMKQLEITAGCTAYTYCPDLPVTRGQMAVFVVRALQSKNRVPQSAINEFSYTTGQQFSDVPSSHIFYPYIQRMKDLGITSGCSATAYCPDDPNTRGQISVFLARGLFALWDGRSQ